MSKKNILKDISTNYLTNKTNLFIVLLALLLITIPLKPIFGSIVVIVFAIVSFSGFYKLQFKLNRALILPVVLYFVMACSLFWTTSFEHTFCGIQKEASLLVLPLAFLFLPKFEKKSVYKAFRWFGFSMVIFALYSIARAFYRFYETGNQNVFLFNDLVSTELNAIYIAAFTSFCLFYFIALKNKKPIDFIAIYILAVFVFLLYSKTIFFIDFCILIWFYFKKGSAQKSVKWVTIIMGITFLFLSILYVPQVRARFKQEYQTAFVDNTIYSESGKKDKNANYITIKKAWTQEAFNPQSYFPGAAFRVFQIRIFKETFQEQNLWFTGLGQDASEQSIKEKHKQYQLFNEYHYFNFHNQYIQIFAELGIFGFLIFVFMMGLNIKNALSNNNFLHFAFAFTMIVLFLTESVLCRQRGIIFFITLYCIFNSIDYKTKEKQIRKTK
jgi:O-antigen ligase